MGGEKQGLDETQGEKKQDKGLKLNHIDVIILNINNLLQMKGKDTQLFFLSEA